MNKTQLISAVAAKSGLSKKDSDKAVNAVFEAIKDSLVAGEKVQIVGFGAFEIKQREAHIGRNPKTMEEIQVKASRVASFRAGKGLKNAVGQSKE